MTARVLIAAMFIIVSFINAEDLRATEKFKRAY
jgi:hypothetical protein